MANFKIPDGPKQYVANLTDFLGVDFTSIDIDDWERTLELVREGQRVINEEYMQCENDMNFE